MVQAAAPLDKLPGFRRRFRVSVAPGRVQAEVEDDYHCMSVIVCHEDGVATQILPEMRRAPWTTCPGAAEQLIQTFHGVALQDFAKRGEKFSNCTHLHDLALLAAEHVNESASVIYDILVSDPVDGKRTAELRSNGKTLVSWIEESFVLVSPPQVAGLQLLDLRAWMNQLEPEMKRAVRLLRWGNMIANGRTIPLEQQSDATKMPPNCYTFQPDRAAVAKRVGIIRDFSRGGGEPLDEYKPAF